MSLAICIMTPDRIFLDTEVEEIILPTNTGQIGILPNHTRLLTGLDVGIMLIRETKDWESVALMGGFALIKENRITILVNEADSVQSVDSTEAEFELTQARLAFQKATTPKEKIETNLVLKRAEIRVQLSQTT